MSLNSWQLNKMRTKNSRSFLSKNLFLFCKWISSLNLNINYDVNACNFAARKNSMCMILFSIIFFNSIIILFYFYMTPPPQKKKPTQKTKQTNKNKTKKTKYKIESLYINILSVFKKWKRLKFVAIINVKENLHILHVTVNDIYMYKHLI